MACWLVRVFGWVRQHPWRVLSLVVCLIAAALSGPNLWAWYHFRAADRALTDEQLNAARDHISCCLRIWRRDPASHLLAARIERASGHYPQAEQHLNDCIRLQHGASEQTQLEQTLLRAQSGDLADVELGLWKCVNAGHPRSARILETLARVYEHECRLEAAMTCLNLWIEREPAAARAWHWRGWTHEFLEQPNKAIADYRKALELDPGRWGARLRLARLLLQLNNPQSARPHLEELLRHHADDAEVQLLQARVFRLEGNAEEAARLLDRLLQRNPRHLGALTFSAKLLCERDPPRYDEAERLLRRALAELPTNHSALHALYKCLQNQDKVEETAEIRARLDRLEADLARLRQLRLKGVASPSANPQLLGEMGELLLRLGSEEAGLVWLHRALRADPNHAPSRKALIRYYQSKGQSGSVSP